MIDREIKDRTILDIFAEDFVRVVEIHVKYIIVSGFVAIAHGRSRGTEDIDMIVERMSKDEFIMMHHELEAAAFECMQSDNPDVIYDDYLNDNLSVRYVRKDSFIPEMELKFTKNSLDDYQIKTRTKLPLTGLDFYFSSIEMNLAFKEELLKSEKYLEDAHHLRIIYSDIIDENEISKIKAEIRRLYSI
jgi:hypothetical protein